METLSTMGKMNTEIIRKLWDKAQEYSNSLPAEERDARRTVGFYDCLCRIESHPEQGEQGELYKWVKASERLPEADGQIVFRNSEGIGLGYYEKEPPEGEEPFFDEGDEWLCKLSSPPPQDERIKELENFLRTIRTGDLETIRKEASCLLIKK